MNEAIIMTEKGTTEELLFALNNDLNFSKHQIDELLDPVSVANICNKLNVRASLEANVYEDSHRKRAYYSLQFTRADERYGVAVATYFGKTLVDSDNNYTIEPEVEVEE